MPDTPGEDLTATGAPPPADSGERIGPYRLLDKLGEGGMGEVWLAEQQQPVKRKVALKLIKQGMDTRQVVARFEAEKQALALMDDPAIAKVYDAGTTPAGRPYFAMEYVRGVPITEYCDRHRLTTRERLGLFMQVCEGVQHAHQKAVIHRDLKPSNVLVSIQNDKPVPKIIDFGVAKATAQKLTEQTMHTQLGVMIGTPAYMSPEQAEMTGQDIDTRTDVYALGVMLYELLVGALPFDMKEVQRAGFEALVRRIREDEPPRPSTRLSTLGEHSTRSARQRQTEVHALVRELSGDLDWITLKALEKDRTRRYSSAHDLAADIERYLTDQPVLASPPSAAYRAKKFVKRHTWGVTAAAVGLLTLVAFAATMGMQAKRIAVERDLARQARAELESVVAFQAGMLNATDPVQMGRRLVEKLSERVGEARGAAARTSLAGLVGGVNATDLALDLVDEEILGAAVETLDETFGDRPLIDARLRGTIGDTYRKLGRYARAEPQLDKALEIRQRVLGDEHPDTLTSMNDRALLYRNLGRNDEARSELARVLETRKRVLGDDHPDTLTSMNDLALVHWSLGRNDEAEPLYVAALNARKRVLGDDHPATLDSLNNLTLLYWGQGRYDEAEPLYVKTLETQRRLLGEDHPDTLKSMNNLATLYRSQGRYDEAEPLLRQALESAKRVFGSKHPATFLVMGNLGELHVMQQRPDLAEPLLAEAVDTVAGALPREHVITGSLIRKYGVCLTALGRYDEAEVRLLEAQEILAAAVRPDHPDAQKSIANLVDLYEAWGKPAKAAALRARRPEHGGS